MKPLLYTRYELLRTLRNRRFFVLSLGFPLVLYFLIAGPQRNDHSLGGTGISAPLYFMVGMVAFGTMSSMLSCGARIAAERAVGWNRQLRISPLSTRAYFRAKVLTAYLTALLTMAVLYASGAALGVSMPAKDWVEMTILILICLVPFAALGVAIGHMLTPDSIGPAMGGGVALLAFLGGTWFPIPSHGFLYDVGQLLPSYWLVQASHIALGAHPFGAKAWAVIAIWTVVLVAVARRAYRRDTRRV
ncbi:MAG TPA: ABC transporter permease [Solirubrobacteraceae bacterium]|jgi:ABC-2 type transport system permease protein